MTFIKRKRKEELKLKVAQFKGVITSRAQLSKINQGLQDGLNMHLKISVILMKLYMDPLRIE